MYGAYLRKIYGSGLHFGVDGKPLSTVKTLRKSKREVHTHEHDETIDDPITLIIWSCTNRFRVKELRLEDLEIDKTKRNANIDQQ